MSDFLEFPDFVGHIERVLPRYFRYRCGKLGPARTFLTVVNMTIFGQRGYRRVLGELRNGLAAELGWLWEERPTSAALCKARRKLTEEQCELAFRETHRLCTSARANPELTYKGMSIYLIDGTRLQLPCSEELLDHFGHTTSTDGPPSAATAGLVMLWDASAQQPVAHRLVPYAHCERTEARALFDHLSSDSLLITDRGFPSLEIFAELTERQQPFLMRLQKSFSKESNDFVASDARDQVVHMPIKPRNKLTRSESESTTPIRLIKVLLPPGQKEILATNLMSEDDHQAGELGRLYTTRWRIETAFREMKIWHALEDFSATHVRGIIQEVYAAFVFALLASEMEAKVRAEHAELTEARTDDEPLPTIRYNRLLISDAVVGAIMAAQHGQEAVRAHVNRAIDYIWRNRSKRRPGRLFPRKGQRKQKANG